MTQQTYNAKRLHVHSLPLAIFALAATAAVLVIGAAGLGSDRLALLARPLITLKPSSNGLAVVKLNKPATDADRLRQAIDQAIQAQSVAAPAAGISINGTPQATIAPASDITPAMPGVEGLGASAALKLSVQ